MAPPNRSVESRRVSYSPSQASGAYMAFSISLFMAYQREARGKHQKPPRTRHKQTAPSSRAPRHPKTIAPSIVSRVQQLPDLPTAVTCDATQERLSTEAQLIQDQARDSYNARVSAKSDRESLRLLESFPLKIPSRSALDRASLATLEHATSRQKYSPPHLLPKYYPPKYPSPHLAFDEDAPRTTHPTNSSGQPLEPIEDDGHSFSDDSELFRDDDLFRDDGTEVDDLFLNHDGDVDDRLAYGGVSTLARLEEIRARQADGERSFFARLEDISARQDYGGCSVSLASSRKLSEVVEDWQHVKNSAELRHEIEVDEQQSTFASEVVQDGDVELESSEWHADPITIPETMYESDSEDNIREQVEGDLLGLEEILKEAMEEPAAVATAQDEQEISEHELNYQELTGSEVDTQEHTNHEEQHLIKEATGEANEWLHVEDAALLHQEMTGDEF